MAKNPSAYLLFLAILVLTTATASSLNLAAGTQVQIVGFVTCPVRRIPPPSGPPVAGANVSLSCDGARTSLGQAVTNAGGFYSINLNVSAGLLFNTTGCAIFVNLPLANCTSVPASGVVRTDIRPVAVLPTTISLLPLVINQIIVYLSDVLKGF